MERAISPEQMTGANSDPFLAHGNWIVCQCLQPGQAHWEPLLLEFNLFSSMQKVCSPNTYLLSQEDQWQGTWGLQGFLQATWKGAVVNPHHISHLSSFSSVKKSHWITLVVQCRMNDLRLKARSFVLCLDLLCLQDKQKKEDFFHHLEIAQDLVAY